MSDTAKSQQGQGQPDYLVPPTNAGQMLSRKYWRNVIHAIWPLQRLVGVDGIKIVQGDKETRIGLAPTAADLLENPGQPPGTSTPASNAASTNFIGDWETFSLYTNFTDGNIVTRSYVGAGSIHYQVLYLWRGPQTTNDQSPPNPDPLTTANVRRGNSTYPAGTSNCWVFLSLSALTDSSGFPIIPP